MSIGRTVCLPKIISEIDTEEKYGGIWLTRECYVRLLLILKKWTSCFPTDKKVELRGASVSRTVHLQGCRLGGLTVYTNRSTNQSFTVTTETNLPSKLGMSQNEGFCFTVFKFFKFFILRMLKSCFLNVFIALMSNIVIN